jgi:hypothetical protein
LGGSKAIVIDTTAPSITATAVGGAIADGTASWETGFVASGGKYYVYAFVSDNVTVGSVSATVTNIAGASTTVPLSSGSWPNVPKAGGGTATYNYRSALLTAGTLTEGTNPTFTVSASDTATNPVGPVAGSSVTVDNTAPTPLTINAPSLSNGKATFSGTGGRATGDATTVTVVVCNNNVFPCTGTGNTVEFGPASAVVSPSTGAWTSAQSGNLGNNKTHYAQASQSDAAGNVSTATTAQFTS